MQWRNIAVECSPRPDAQQAEMLTNTVEMLSHLKQKEEEIMNQQHCIYLVA